MGPFKLVHNENGNCFFESNSLQIKNSSWSTLSSSSLFIMKLKRNHFLCPFFFFFLVCTKSVWTECQRCTEILILITDFPTSLCFKN